MYHCTKVILIWPGGILRWGFAPWYVSRHFYFLTVTSSRISLPALFAQLSSPLEMPGDWQPLAQLHPALPASPQHNTSHQPAPYVWRPWPRSYPIPWQWAGRKKSRTVHRFVSECRVSPGLLPAGTHIVIFPSSLDIESEDYSCFVPSISQQAAVSHCPARSCAFGMSWRKVLDLCLDKHYRILSGTRIHCSSESHMPSLTDIWWPWHDKKQAAFH